MYDGWRIRWEKVEYLIDTLIKLRCEQKAYKLITHSPTMEIKRCSNSEIRVASYQGLDQLIVRKKNS